VVLKLEKEDLVSIRVRSYDETQFEVVDLFEGDQPSV
jgi:hypothetical protein